MLFAGIDAHRSSSYITVMDDHGDIVQRGEITTSREAFYSRLGHYNEPLKAVLEASFSWGPVYDWLEEFSEEVKLAHPLKVRAIAEARIKTDSIDSETLAHLLRADLIPEAHAPSRDVRAAKRVLRQRMFLVRVRTMLKNRVHSLIAQHDVPRPGFSDIFGVKGLEWLHSLEFPEPDGSILEEELKLIQVVKERVESSDTLIRRLSADDEAVQLLHTIPGIGDFFSVLIRYEADDIHRFRTAKKFTAYTGLVPSTYASGNRVFHGRLTKQGNKWLRWAFVEAVSPAVRSSVWLRKYYNKIKVRRGTKDARTATARKIAHLAWKIWTEKRAYKEYC